VCVPAAGAVALNDQVPPLSVALAAVQPALSNW